MAKRTEQDITEEFRAREAGGSELGIYLINREIKDEAEKRREADKFFAGHSDMGSHWSGGGGLPEGMGFLMTLFYVFILQPLAFLVAIAAVLGLLALVNSF